MVLSSITGESWISFSRTHFWVEPTGSAERQKNEKCGPLGLREDRVQRAAVGVVAQVERAERAEFDHGRKPRRDADHPAIDRHMTPHVKL